MARIDLNCPAEILRTEIEEDQVRLILMNLTDRAIDSCEATARVLNREGEELGREVHRGRALKGRPHSAFSMTVPMEMPEKAARAEAVLDKVWFEDHDVWRRDPRRETEYEPNALPAGNALNALKYVAGDGAVGFPSQQAEVWVCVCGRPNGNGEMLCARCQRRKDMIFQQYSENAVARKVNMRERQLELQTRSAREEAAQLQRAREAEHDARQRRKKTWIRWITGIAAALLLAAALQWGVRPAIRLWQADTALREDRLEEARDALIALKKFPGAETRLAEAEQRIARRDGEKAAEDATAFPEEEMLALASRLREMGNGEEDRKLADRVTLSAARARLEKGDLNGTEALMPSIPAETEGRGKLERDLVFARGEEKMSAGEYVGARELFLSLGEDPEAAARARDALYREGLRCMEAGEYETAMACFRQLGDWEDGESLIAQCQYLQAVQLEAEGEEEAARLAYLAAGEYDDAAARARAIRWRQAERFLAAQDWENALPLYREMDGDGDARSKWIQCATELARAAYRKKEYETAAEILTGLPEDTKTTRQIRTRGWYLGAKAAASRKEWEKAITMMENVPDYADAQRNLRNWRIEWARERMQEGQYTEARKILEPVAETYQARRVLEEIDKAEAEARTAALTEEKEAGTETEAPDAVLTEEKGNGTGTETKDAGTETEAPATILTEEKEAEAETDAPGKAPAQEK